MADNKPFILREYLLDLDPFKKPKVIGNEEAMATLLTRLILLEPGTNPLYPEMGVGIVSKYRFLGEEQENDLKKDITDQIERYFPDAMQQNIEFVYNEDNTMNIEITINDVRFIYDSSILVPITLEGIREH